MLLNKALSLPIHQSDVDFVIPNLAEDLRLYVDPFLFFKSGNEEFQAVHATIQRFFQTAIEHVKAGRQDVARRMMAFPEVNSTMLGLSKGNHEGRGLGPTRGETIYTEIVSNEDVLAHGVSHLAEMQLLIENVGFDMVSDMCTNIVKPFFIHYTQQQCELHGIPVEKGLCVDHVFDWQELDWDSQFADLPTNPRNGNPILLVPKAVVRRFEEIDYRDFWTTTYRYMLREIEWQKSIQSIGRATKVTWKEIDEKYDFCKRTVVRVLHEDPALKRRYLRSKEKQSAETVTPTDLAEVSGTDRVQTPLEDYAAQFAAIQPGNAEAKAYERLMVRILTRLFSPPLVHPREQVRSIDGREIKDISFYNGADSGFWQDMKQRHGGLLVPVELKNMMDIGNTEVFQLSARLNEGQGNFGLLIARGKDDKDLQRAVRRFDKEKKITIILADEDILRLLDDRKNGLSMTMYLTKLYRDLVEGA